jgi:hypothetical protein
VNVADAKRIGKKSDFNIRNKTHLSER